MEILPVVEIHCRYELQEECSNLQALMHRFDHERELQSHELGRSLLFMIRDDEAGLESLYRRSQPAAPQNPFDAVRAGLAAVGATFVGLRPQQQVAPALCAACTLRGVYFNEIVGRLAIRWVFFLIPSTACVVLASVMLPHRHCTDPPLVSRLCLRCSLHCFMFCAPAHSNGFGYSVFLRLRFAR